MDSRKQVIDLFLDNFDFRQSDGDLDDPSSFHWVYMKESMEVSEERIPVRRPCYLMFASGGLFVDAPFASLEEVDELVDEMGPWGLGSVNGALTYHNYFSNEQIMSNPSECIAIVHRILLAAAEREFELFDTVEFSKEKVDALLAEIAASAPASSEDQRDFRLLGELYLPYEPEVLDLGELEELYFYLITALMTKNRDVEEIDTDFVFTTDEMGEWVSLDIFVIHPSLLNMPIQEKHWKDFDRLFKIRYEEQPELFGADFLDSEDGQFYAEARFETDELVLDFLGTPANLEALIKCLELTEGEMDADSFGLELVYCSKLAIDFLLQ